MIKTTTDAITIGISTLKRNASPIRTGRKIAKNFTLSMIPPKNYFLKSIH